MQPNELEQAKFFVNEKKLKSKMQNILRLTKGASL